MVASFPVDSKLEFLDSDEAAAAKEISNGRKAKKTCKIKKKKSVSANELVDEGDQIPCGKDDCSAGTIPGKVKKVRKNKRKHCVSMDKASELADDAGESEKSVGDQKPSGEQSCTLGTESKVRKVHKNKKKKCVTPNEESKLADEGGEYKRDNGDQISTEQDTCSRGTNNKLKRASKSKRKDHSSPKDENNSVQTQDEPYEIHQISSGEGDCSRGMKKWIEEYHMNRPGFEVLQQRIDDFITAFEEQEEQARKDREAEIAEDGWTVVVHRKGGKKTSDPESGVVVGSVSQGAVLHKMDKKKSKEVGLDFYRFQRREAQRSEVMKLQSKFEEDKKRIQQLRAARKFKPY